MGGTSISKGGEEETKRLMARYPRLDFDDFPVPPKDATRREIEDHRKIRSCFLGDWQIIRKTGQEGLAALSQHPPTFTREEIARFEERGRNKVTRGAKVPVSQYNYTGPRRPHVFRCPLYGCGGDIINGAFLERAMVPHFQRFHPRRRARNAAHTFKVQTQ